MDTANDSPLIADARSHLLALSGTYNTRVARAGGATESYHEYAARELGDESRRLQTLFEQKPEQRWIDKLRLNELAKVYLASVTMARTGLGQPNPATRKRLNNLAAGFDEKGGQTVETQSWRWQKTLDNPAPQPEPAAAAPVVPKPAKPAPFAVLSAAAAVAPPIAPPAAPPAPPVAPTQAPAPAAQIPTAANPVTEAEKQMEPYAQQGIDFALALWDRTPQPSQDAMIGVINDRLTKAKNDLKQNYDTATMAQIGDVRASETALALATYGYGPQMANNTGIDAVKAAAKGFKPLIGERSMSGFAIDAHAERLMDTKNGMASANIAAPNVAHKTATTMRP
ncbi:MAG: hypothetical protein H6865_03145 [Rhodospirillales bacterium]|nr:hypothetical protein [Alphaproteobacteria bacterium]MCB9986614.1 hypothetical protein [Rhodospirillales bacterium]USO06856.1 MAG: hypothetical protein H6866_05240 [Rhodospirillales bacterium]